jgi:2-methylcitrate dehydratase PrpD
VVDKKLLPDLAAQLSGLKARDIDAATLDKVKLHGFDALACAWAGAETSEIKPTHDALKRAAFLTPPKSFFDHPGCAAAMLVTSSRLTECDDIHIGSCVTPSSVVVPVALAMGHITKAAPETVLEAIVGGYQVMLTLGLAANGAENIYRGVWTTFLTGGITAAAIAARVMGLSEKQIRNAMAIAATSATGVTGRAEEEPAPRWFVLATAIQSGLLAAAAAERGMSGDEAVLGRVSPVWSAEAIKVPEQAGPGSPLLINRVGFKPYCSSRQGLSATEAFILAVREEKIDTSKIEKITIAVPNQYRAMIDRTNRPKTKTESRGIHYQLAIGALHHDELCDIERATIRDNDPAILHIMDRVEVVGSEKLTKLYPKQWGGTATITVGGKTIEREVLNPLGDPENPMGWDAVTAKLDTMSRYLKRPIPTQKLSAQVKALDLEGCVTTLLGSQA